MELPPRRRFYLDDLIEGTVDVEFGENSNRKIGHDTKAAENVQAKPITPESSRFLGNS